MKTSVAAIFVMAMLIACKGTSTAETNPNTVLVESPDSTEEAYAEDDSKEEENVVEESAAKSMEVLHEKEVSAGEKVVLPVESKSKIGKMTPAKDGTKISKPEVPVANPTPELVQETKPTSKPQGSTVKKIQKSEKLTKPAPPASGGIPDHKVFDALLSAHVSASGQVDYKALKGKMLKLDAYLLDLQTNAPQTSWSEDEELAYWINTYNAFTIKLILKNYPIKSITDLHGGKPWDVKWIEIDGQNYSLNNIENDIIRPKFNEPRIHFAVNCAAQSCPPLANQAFTADNLDGLLDKQTKAFINNSKYNQLSKKEITVSKIFDWYGKDFGNVATFVSRYASVEVSPAATVNFSEYDWSLNGM